MINTLFTSVGRRVELVEAFRKAYADLQLDGRIVGIDVNPLSSALRRVDKGYVVPPLNSPDFGPRLIEICKAERIHQIFPLIDPDLEMLAKIRSALKLHGTQVAVLQDDMLPLVSDKWQTYLFFKKLGLNVPRSWLPHDNESVASDFPLFLRPRKGSASVNAFEVRDGSELMFLLRRIEGAFCQEFLDGPEITNDVVSTLDGHLLGVVSRQRLEVRGGEVTKAVTIFDSRILDACTRIANALGAVGPITVQCIMRNGIPHFTEINARFGGGAPLGFAAGMDSPRWLLAKAAGIPITIPSVGTYKVGLCMTRCDRSFFIDETDIDAPSSDTL